MKPGRNDPCSCGSGKKFKHCCEGKLASRTPMPSPAEINPLVALFNTGRHVELESRARLLVDQFPNFGFGWKLLGGSLQMQGKDALYAFQKTAKLMPDDAGAHFNLGVVQKSLGQLDAAVASYRRALKIKPDYAEAHSNLGNALKDLGQLDDAVASYRHALKIKPDSAEAHNNLGTALKDTNLLNDALASYRRAVEIKPNYAEAHYNLGNVLKDLGQFEDAAESYRRALELKPDLADAYKNFGSVLNDLRQYEAALENYRRALELKPGSAETHFNVGVALKNLGQLDGAVASYRRAVEIKPDFAEAYINLGAILQNQNRLAAAEASYRRAVELKPDLAEAHHNLATVLQDQRRLAEAEASYRRALEIKPDLAEAHSNLGAVLQDQRRVAEAEAICRRALEIKPDLAEAHHNLGTILQFLGRTDEAAASYRRALEIKPDYIDAQSKLLFTLNYMAGNAPAYCLAEAHQYGRMVAKKVTARFSAWQCAAKPERLRVGMVSGDLSSHPVGYFLEGLLAQLDHTRVELIAYPTRHREDELTARIRPHFSAWKPLFDHSDEAAARLIHADGVHVLLDLAGHTAHNRLPVFAWKPAPVQASWLGYFATTGVEEMDYLLADKMGVPEAQRGDFRETMWYLPDTRLCFTPPEVDLPVASLPALKNGHITFGCFQNLSKVGDEVLTAWGKILTALPGAKLRWQCKQLGDSAVAKQLALRLQQHGIDPARVSLHGAVSRETYLAAHAEVDMMLDTFPYPGGTTTCEALWMGVPTLTLAGDTLLARQGASLLTAAGLGDWVATSVADYVDKAVALAGDLPKLAALRAGLREQASASPLFDAPRFARNFETALWGMWQARTQGNSPTPPELLAASRD